MENNPAVAIRFLNYRITGIDRSRTLKILSVLILPLFGAPLHAALFLGLGLWALAGPRQALEALSLSWLATFLNPGIYSLSSSGEALRWGVLLASFVSVFLRFVLLKKIRFPRTWWWLLGFVLVATGLSFFTSYAFDVSLFKIITFFMGTSTILLGSHMTSDSSEYWKSWFLAIFLIVAMLGFPLLFNPMGYFRNGRGFQGLLNHPQAYGVFLGPLCAWLLFLLVGKERRGISWWVFLGLSFVSLVATQSRTGMLCFVLSPLIVIFLKLLKGDIPFSILRRGMKYLSFFFILLIPIAYVFRDSIVTSVNEFAFKRTAYENIEDAFYASRGFLVSRSLQNFIDNPVLGIGFGVASDPSTFIIRRDTLTGLPVGASIEKGMLVVAILEELGLVGASIFIILLYSLLSPTFRRGVNLSSATLSVAAFLINFGESVFFSFGGMGTWMWLLIGASRVFAKENG